MEDKKQWFFVFFCLKVSGIGWMYLFYGEHGTKSSQHLFRLARKIIQGLRRSISSIHHLLFYAEMLRESDNTIVALILQS